MSCLTITLGPPGLPPLPCPHLILARAGPTSLQTVLVSSMIAAEALPRFPPGPGLHMETILYVSYHSVAKCAYPWFVQNDVRSLT